MATLLRADGTTKPMHPANGVHWKLSELEALVGGFIEVARTVEGKYLVLDEEGKLKHKPLNVAATRLYQYGRRDPIVGDVVLVDTLLEMEGPEEEAEEEEE